MKNILYISSNDPEYSNGGAIGTRKILGVLKELETKRKIQIYEIVCKEKEMKNKGKYYIEIPRKKWKAYFSRILGLADQLELETKKILKVIEKENIKIVVIQSSRLGNISRKIKKYFPNIKIIQHFDNFEYEFSKMFTQNMNLIIRKIEPYNVIKSEKKAIENMNIGLFLTQKDLCNINNFYKREIKGEIIPIFYENSYDKKLKITKKEQTIFTGSLDMEANIQACLFLINNYEVLFENLNINLILAGRNPDIRIYKAIEKNKKAKEKIKIIDNPLKKEMEILIRESLFYISPVFEGSGIKTKFTEALFYGIPIIASEHTMIGYEGFQCFNLKILEIFKDKDIEDLKIKMEILYKNIKNKNYTEKIRNLYFENFSKDKLLKTFERIIDEI